MNKIYIFVSEGSKERCCILSVGDDFFSDLADDPSDFNEILHLVEEEYSDSDIEILENSIKIYFLDLEVKLIKSIVSHFVSFLRGREYEIKKISFTDRE
jgi:hypothetical protein